jgi:hypothetical protein
MVFTMKHFYAFVINALGFSLNVNLVFIIPIYQQSYFNHLFLINL